MWAIAAGLGVSRPTVQLWRKRVRELGIGEIWEIAPGRGRKAHYDQGSESGSLKRPCRASQGHDPLELPADGESAKGQ